MGMLVVLCFLVMLLSMEQSVRGSTIVVTSNTGNNDYWVAYSVSDPSTTNVELMDSGSYHIPHHY